jgi:hypothetical protein
MCVSKRFLSELQPGNLVIMATDILKFGGCYNSRIEAEA